MIVFKEILNNVPILERDLLFKSDEFIWNRKFSKYWGEETAQKHYKEFMDFFKDYNVAFSFYSFLTSVVHKSKQFHFTMKYQPYLDILDKYLKNYSLPYIDFFKKWWKIFHKNKYLKQVDKNEHALVSFLIRWITIAITPERALPMIKKYGFTNIEKAIDDLKKQGVLTMNESEVLETNLINNIVVYYQTQNPEIFLNFIKKEILTTLKKWKFLKSLEPDLYQFLTTYYPNALKNLSYDEMERVLTMDDEKDIVNYFGGFGLAPADFLYSVLSFPNDYREWLESYQLNNQINLYAYLKSNNDLTPDDIIQSFFQDNFARFTFFKIYKLAQDTKLQNFSIIDNFINDFNNKIFNDFDTNKKMLYLYANILQNNFDFFQNYIFTIDLNDLIDVIYS